MKSIDELKIGDKVSKPIFWFSNIRGVVEDTLEGTVIGIPNEWSVLVEYREGMEDKLYIEPIERITKIAEFIGKALI